MHPAFLDYLVDPVSGQPLELVVHRRRGDTILDGELVSPTASYPIVRGVPRFAGFLRETDYVRSFTYQWSRWAAVQFESENLGGPMAGHTTRMWERITGVKARDLGGEVVGDFGCGPGRFVDVVRKRHARVIGLDLSSAVEWAAERFAGDEGVLICQADILQPPVRPDSLGGAFSIGVLHHTPAPARGVAAMVRSVRRGGWVAASVYPKGGYYDRRAVRMWRRLFRWLWPLAGPSAPLLYARVAAHVGCRAMSVPGGGRLFGALLPFVPLPDMRWAVLDTFDSVTPAFQSTHTGPQVRQWFHDSVLVGIEETEWSATSYRARRS